MFLGMKECGIRFYAWFVFTAETCPFRFFAILITLGSKPGDTLDPTSKLKHWTL